MPRVLVVDDEPNIRLLISIVLQELDCEVRTARDGWECLNYLEREPFDLIFLDLRMPRLGGADVLARLRAEPRLRSVPVVIVTGSSEAQPSLAICGAQEVLTKPFDIDVLLAVAQRYLSGSSLRLSAPRVTAIGV